MKNKITKEHEEKILSQSGEDGIISHIFQAIGTTNKIAVEIGVTANISDTLYENNTANLAVNNDWQTVWIDAATPEVLPPQCQFIQSYVTVRNIKSLFESAKVPVEFDLLSIDIDSNDFYIRELLSIYSPRVYVMEYNGCFDAHTEYVMPYNESYVWRGDHHFGASLKSLTNQADKLGYDLVYCTDNGVNAFYVRKDINPFYCYSTEEIWSRVIWNR